MPRRAAGPIQPRAMPMRRNSAAATNSATAPSQVVQRVPMMDSIEGREAEGDGDG